VLLVMLIISRLSVLPHKHPHELLDSVVKEHSVKSFASTKATHSTAAFLSVKLFFEFVSGETSFYSTTWSNLSFISSASVRRAFYSASLLRQVVFEEIFFLSQQLSASSNLGSSQRGAHST
jgi:hypothetical protein